MTKAELERTPRLPPMENLYSVMCKDLESMIAFL